MGGVLIFILCEIALPHFIPVVLWMMYYIPFARMNMRRYLYNSRTKLVSLPDDLLFDAVLLVHSEWKMVFLKPVWILRINILVFCLFAGCLWLIRLYLLDSVPYNDVIFHIAASFQACLLLWMNIRQYLWLKEEIPQCNEELF